MITLDERLVPILVDPEDKQSLWLVPSASVLFNERSGRVYVITDGIPVLLIDDARIADDTERAALLAAEDKVRTGPPS